jgi:tripartite-type tricarboxylate transporter receptor subunit TctC
MNYVPYRGAAGSSADAIAGQIDLSINFTPAMVGPLKNGSLRGLAVTTLQRSKQLPDIPTVAESGLPGFESVAYYSVVAPAGTPGDIILTLNKMINEYIESDIGKRQLESGDMQPAGGTPEDLKKFIAGEVATWGPIIKSAGIAM